jgi:diguanylate cyclase (GGDEF)-like protein
VPDPDDVCTPEEVRNPAPDGASLGHELAALIEHRRELLVVLDDEGRLTWAGPAASRWFGTRAAGSRLVDLAHPEDAPTLEAALDELRSGRSTVAEARVRLCDQLGQHRPVSITVTDGRDRPGVGGLVCVARQDERAELTDRLIHQATHDHLTALANRAGLLDRLHDPLRSAQEPTVAVLYVDLDRFKDINDTLGHAAGDRVLVVVADRLRRAVRPEDVVARLGGDEFVVVADGVTDRGVALDIARRMVASICQPVALPARIVGVTASVGATVGRRDRGLELLDEADRAMYRAKRAGGNRCTAFDRRLDGSADGTPPGGTVSGPGMFDAEVAVAYQPVVDLVTGQVSAIDASLWLRAPERAFTPPGELLELAEETGMSIPTGAGLADLACAQLARWDSECRLPDRTPLVVPLGARHLSDDSTPTRLVAAATRHGIDPGRLGVRVREVIVADAEPVIAANLERVAATGMRLSVDDFGMGRSSLPYLRRFGVDTIRLDASFSGDARGGEGIDPELVGALVAFGEALGVTVVAKGVDSGHRAALLRDAGCRYGIGAELGEAAPAEELRLPPPR